MVGEGSAWISGVKWGHSWFSREPVVAGQWDGFKQWVPVVCGWLLVVKRVSCEASEFANSCASVCPGHLWAKWLTGSVAVHSMGRALQ